MIICDIQTIYSFYNANWENMHWLCACTCTHTHTQTKILTLFIRGWWCQYLNFLLTSQWTRICAYRKYMSTRLYLIICIFAHYVLNQDLRIRSLRETGILEKLLKDCFGRVGAGGRQRERESKTDWAWSLSWGLISWWGAHDLSQPSHPDDSRKYTFKVRQTFLKTVDF